MIGEDGCEWERMGVVVWEWLGVGEEGWWRVSCLHCLHFGGLVSDKQSLSAVLLVHKVTVGCKRHYSNCIEEMVTVALGLWHTSRQSIQKHRAVLSHIRREENSVWILVNIGRVLWSNGRLPLWIIFLVHGVYCILCFNQGYAYIHKMSSSY